VTGASELRHLPDVPREQVPACVEDFLLWLGGPATLRVPGRDASRVRVVATLLHGNEPSGVRAVHEWLREGGPPATDVLFFVANVEAALAPPGFAHRALPGRPDWNRRFDDRFDDREARIARALRERVARLRPEALVDLHNTTGWSPPYAVGSGVDAPRLALCALFGDRYVHNRLRLGALTESLEGVCPAVTVECGRAGDPSADAAARDGLVRFLSREEVATGRPERDVTVLVDPLRIHLRPGLRVAFADEAEPDAELTIPRDLDRHNFEALPAGSAIGWLAPGAPWPLEAADADGDDASRRWFSAEGGVLQTRREVIPIMMTTDPAIAKSDCLFYVVRRGEASAASPRGAEPLSGESAGPK